MAEIELKAQIAAAEKAIAVAEEAIRKAKAAGINTTQMERDLAVQKAALAKLKAAYGA